MSETVRPPVRADAGDPGLRFVLQKGLLRDADEGHFGTIVGRGGSGKSILALQLVTELLRHAEEKRAAEFHRPHAAFYFTLEASPRELKRQVEQFTWGTARYRGKWRIKDEETRQPVPVSGDKRDRISGDDEYSEGLYLISIPSPAESLNALTLKIRQTIAVQLPQVGDLVAIIIDPMGAVKVDDDLEANLIQLKELAETHRTFVLLLTEKHAFELHKSIEHYSQSIIHLEHDPGNRQHRRLYVQKARGQSFRSGYHYFDLHQPGGGADSALPLPPSTGIRVFPSVEAQSADAHEQISELPLSVNSEEEPRRVLFFPSRTHGKEQNLELEVGSAVFLMGPPGTFKEKLVSEFAEAAADVAADQVDKGATVYLSFKADRGKKELKLDSRSIREGKDVKEQTYFLDARNPLMTPEEILFTIRNAITASGDGHVKFKRAIVWGLRRLYDFSNYREGRAVQFLEALVTMLKSRQITTILVDWPDQATKGTVPIVDLCQYIFLTRVCYREQEADQIKQVSARSGLSGLWENKEQAGTDRIDDRSPDEKVEDTRPHQIALLRIQRTRQGIHHDLGFVYKQFKNPARNQWKKVDSAVSTESFEYLWQHYGSAWEEDLSLKS